MTYNYRDILHRLVRYGRIKSGILYFFFSILPGILIYGLLALVLRTLPGNNHKDLLSALYTYLVFYIAAILVSSLNFHKWAIKKLRYLEDLEKRGLTTGDENRITFVKGWQQTRKTGMAKYCLFDGGIIVGMILVLPISLVSHLLRNRIFIFSDFDEMMLFFARAIVIGYVTGTALYLVKWRYNEHKFIYLTDPLHENN